MNVSRTEYVDSLRRQLDEWRAYLHEVEENAAQRGRQATAGFAERMKDVDREMHEAEEKIAQLTAAGDNEWNRLRGETAQVFTQLNRVFADAVSRLS